MSRIGQTGVFTDGRFDSAALEKMLMDRWVNNPPRIKNSSVNHVTYLLNRRSRISKHTFSNPTPYGHEHTTSEISFAGHLMTKKAKDNTISDI